MEQGAHQLGGMSNATAAVQVFQSSELEIDFFAGCHFEDVFFDFPDGKPGLRPFLGCQDQRSKTSGKRFAVQDVNAVGAKLLGCHGGAAEGAAGFGGRGDDQSGVASIKDSFIDGCVKGWRRGGSTGQSFGPAQLSEEGCGVDFRVVAVGFAAEGDDLRQNFNPRLVKYIQWQTAGRVSDDLDHKLTSPCAMRSRQRKQMRCTAELALKTETACSSDRFLLPCLQRIRNAGR